MRRRYPAIQGAHPMAGSCLMQIAYTARYVSTVDRPHATHNRLSLQRYLNGGFEATTAAHAGVPVSLS